MNRSQLMQKSIQIILDNQDPSGSFPASPSFPRFRFCWPRDGIFTACGAIAGGHPQAARCFLLWMHKTLLRYEGLIDSLEQKIKTGAILTETDFLPARFTMDGNLEPISTEEKEIPFYYEKWPEIYSLSGVDNANTWPNFQTDCYGAWLWGLCYYVRATGDQGILDECRESVDLTIRYLKMTWQMPCYDPWEEYGTKRAVSTLGSIAGGLLAINEYRKDPLIAEWVQEIRSVLREASEDCGFLPKHIGSSDIDGSSLWLFIPYSVFSLDDPITLSTVKEVEKQLLFGGVKRYRKDVYYGGGEWIILTCWLSWYYTTTGNYSGADQLLQWCEAHTEKGGLFPEQVFEHLNFPEIREEWETKWWHESPAPLLWSHAMYLIACTALINAENT